MSEAKYKVGQEMLVPGNRHPIKIVEVETCYRFSPNGALWREEDLTPYVRPIEVGDRVRHKYTQKEIGEVFGIRDGRACIWCDLDDDGDYDWNSYAVESLIRIPTEAGK